MQIFKPTYHKVVSLYSIVIYINFLIKYMYLTELINSLSRMFSLRIVSPQK